MKADSIQDVINILKEIAEQVNRPSIREQLESVMLLLELSKRKHRIKLSLQEAKRIRTRWRMGEDLESLARNFGTTKSNIKNVVYEVTWREKPVELKK